MRTTHRSLLLICLVGSLAFVSGFAPYWFGPTLAAGALLMLAGTLDAWRLLRRAGPRVERIHDATMAVEEWYPVELVVEAERDGWLWVHDRPGARFSHRHLPQRVRCKSGTRTTLRYEVRPGLRGDAQFAPCDVLCSGPLGLLERRYRASGATTVRVFPNFRRVARFATPGVASGGVGIQKQRRRGQGSEFHQLRAFQRGDALRQIDWRAVSKHQRLISREYRDEQNQRVVFLLDCGQRMRTACEGKPLFEYVLESLVLLAYVATRQGDSVSLQTFSGPDRFLPPQRGPQALGRMLQAVYDLHPGQAPSDFSEAVSRLQRRNVRRSLVVLLSDIHEEDCEEVSGLLQSLRRRHVVLLASLRNPALQRQIGEPISGPDGALTFAASLLALRERRLGHGALRAQGVHSMDLEPADLPGALLSHYTNLKRAGVL